MCHYYTTTVTTLLRFRIAALVNNVLNLTNASLGWAHSRSCQNFNGTNDMRQDSSFIYRLEGNKLMANINTCTLDKQIKMHSSLVEHGRHVVANATVILETFDATNCGDSNLGR